MCGRYVVATPFQQMEIDFRALADSLAAPGYAPDYNVAPTKPIPIVWQRREDEGERRLSLVRWGLVPHWAKDPGVGVRAINARIESASEKPTFRDAFVRRRCVLPADGYYEWRTGPGGKQPVFIHAADGGQLALAGLYERWLDAEGRAIWSATVLTRAAVGPLTEIHDRMPVIVPRDRIEPWLDPELRDAERARGLLDLGEAPAWTARQVGPAVGNVRNNGPELVRELTGPDPLF